jgi:uncharacterized YigZ family protein
MKYVDRVHNKTLEIKQSKFMAFLMPYSKYYETLQELKAKHLKARHFVVAYRYLNEFNQVVEHSSDDGEPKGTSGKPTLMVLQGANIINSAVITVRYFGGTKLGTGGLVRAYSDVTNLVINEANLLQYKQKITKTITFDYCYIGKIDYACQEYDVEIVEKLFNNNVLYTIQSTKENIDSLMLRIDRLII